MLAGGAYTCHNEKTGTVPTTLGFAKNCENPSTDTIGTDAHLDLGAAQFLNEQFFAGVRASQRGRFASLMPNRTHKA